MEVILLIETAFTRRMLRIDDVCKKTGYAESSIWRLAKQGDFPPPVKLSPGCTAWYEHKIDEWLEAKATKSDLTSWSVGGTERGDTP